MALVAGLAALIGLAVFRDADQADQSPGVAGKAPPPSAQTAPNWLGAGRPLAPPAPSTPVTEPAAQPAEWSARLRAEHRDPPWAEKSEAVLTGQLLTVPMLTPENGLQVRCAATLCEVRGFAPAGLDDEGRQIYWRMVQGPAVRSFMAQRGLIAGAADMMQSGAFTIYYTRR